MSKQELVDSMIFSLIDLLLKTPNVGKKHIRSALKLAMAEGAEKMLNTLFGTLVSDPRDNPLAAMMSNTSYLPPFRPCLSLDHLLPRVDQWPEDAGALP